MQGSRKVAAENRKYNNRSCIGRINGAWGPQETGKANKNVSD
jgi:hypothetical protein